MMDLDKVRQAVVSACGLHLDAEDTADEAIRILSAGPTQDELVGQRIAEQIIARIDACTVIEHSRQETAWLVELKGSRPEWAMVSTDWDDDWTTDSLKALRFARRADAEAYIEHYGWTEAFASEHMWTATPEGSGRSLADATKEEGQP